MLGNFEIHDFNKSTAILMFLCITFFVMILMLNLLIAIMSDSYDKVKERELVEGLKEKAKTIVGMELLHPSMHSFPKYMHIAEPESDMINVSQIRTERDNGMSGRIANRLVKEVDERISVLEQHSNQRSAVLEQQVKSVEAAQRKMQGDVDEVKQLLTSLIQRI
jgi:hypothetical protein